MAMDLDAGTNSGRMRSTTSPTATAMTCLLRAARSSAASSMPSANADPVWYRSHVVQLEPVLDASELPEPPQPAVVKTFTGGARVGWGSASWPFAKLRISAERLELSMPILGNYRFEPKNVIAVEKIRGLPVIGQGIRATSRRLGSGHSGFPL